MMQHLRGLLMIIAFHQGYSGLAASNSNDLKQLEIQSYSNVISYFGQKSFDNPDVLLNDQLRDLMPLISERLMGRSQKLPKAYEGVLCSSCVGAVDGLLALYDANLVDQNYVFNAAVNICKTVLGLKKIVCEGAISNFLPEIWYIIENKRSELSGGIVCAIQVGGKCGKWEEISQWSIDIPGNKPPVSKPEQPATGSPTSKILHLTDIHLDLSYTVGTNTDCGRPMCCSNDTEMAPSEDLAAGYWGSYSCDVPTWTLEDMLNHIKEHHLHEIEYIMMTGDNPPHDVWAQSRHGNLEHSREVARIINKVFGDTGKQVIFALGNHESFPCNSFPPVSVNVPEFDISWFYESISEIYSPWLPKSAVESLKRDGSYSFLLRPGFRIIVINSNVCVTYNFWSMYEWEDMNGELKWLTKELETAESNGELVHIVSHVPPGNHDCLGGWGKEFSRIVDRFESTIMAQFYGHTHNDEFVVFYDTETNSRPTSVGFVTPSVSSYTNLNMGYRLYTIDGFYPGNSLRVIETETYLFDLDTANFNGPNVRPTYFKFYEGKAGLEIDNLFPEDFDLAARRMAKDDIYYEKYLRIFNKAGFHDQVKEEVICGLVTSSYIDDRKCKEIFA